MGLLFLTLCRQTSEFIRALRPPHVVLVHGEQNEMARLRAALVREYEDAPVDSRIEVHSPRNSHTVELTFRGEKMAKVVGVLGTDRPTSIKQCQVNNSVVVTSAVGQCASK